VAATVVIAVCIPFFGKLLGKVGGLTDATLAFIVPALIKTVGNNNSDYRLTMCHKLFYSVIGIWGVCLVTYTCNELFGDLLSSGSAMHSGYDSSSRVGGK
jgi:hypothetical protein